MDSLGDRMKAYEDNTRLPKGAVCIRVDGKGFHTWTKLAKLNRPFDVNMHNAMLSAAFKCAEDMQGFRLAYTQSDECTFLLANPEEMAGAWFDYKLQKLVSLTASMFTVHFNEYLRKLERIDDTPLAFFDARAFSIPIGDAANAFVWRQQDNARNYIQALAHSVFSHKEIQGKSNVELTIDLIDIGKDPKFLPAWARFGTVLTRNYYTHQANLSYYDFNELIGFEESLDAAN